MKLGMRNATQKASVAADAPNAVLMAMSRARPSTREIIVIDLNDSSPRNKLGVFTAWRTRGGEISGWRKAYWWAVAGGAEAPMGHILRKRFSSPRNGWMATPRHPSQRIDCTSEIRDNSALFHPQLNAFGVIPWPTSSPRRSARASRK